VERAEAALKTEIGRVEMTLRADITRVEASLRGEVSRIADRTFNRLGTLVAVVAGILFAALHFWPPH
jgi:hypothetical protein